MNVVSKRWRSPVASAGRAGIAKLVIQNLLQALGEEEQIVCVYVCLCAHT